MVSTFNDPDRYWMASIRNNGEDGYTVGSEWVKAWLPDAAAPESDGGASGASVTEQRFLINLSGASQGVSGQAGVQGDTMTISELKALVTRIQNELTAGNTEDHARCVRSKYSEARYEQWDKTLTEDDEGGEYNRQHEREISSDDHAGTVVYVSEAVSHLDAEDLPTPADIDDVILHFGQDATLFHKTWPLSSVTGRPLPQGTYRFYWAAQPSYYALCDALPELLRTRDEVIVTGHGSRGHSTRILLRSRHHSLRRRHRRIQRHSQAYYLLCRRHIHLHHGAEMGERIRSPHPLTPRFPGGSEARLYRPRRLH